MQNPDLFKFLKSFLMSKGIETQEYEEYWSSLGDHDDLPCPLCFTKSNKASKLTALPEKGGLEPVKCESCKEVFYKPAPK